MLVSQLGYPQFELVVYTKENALTFYPIIEGLDPGNQVGVFLFLDRNRAELGSLIVYLCSS